MSQRMERLNAFFQTLEPITRDLCHTMKVRRKAL